MTRSQVADNERSLTFTVASQFINVELAESALELVNQDLKSFQNTVDIGHARYNAGDISEDDLLKIKLQLLQFQTDVSAARLARVQGLSDLRQLLGYESIRADYEVASSFDYQPVKDNVEDFQAKALQTRPDLRAAQQGVTAANSQYQLQKAVGKKDVTGQINYTHLTGVNNISLFGQIPLPIFDRNQGEIARTGFYVAVGANQFGRREVEIGQSENGQTEIVKGISVGERVVGDGSLFLQFPNSLQH